MSSEGVFKLSSGLEGYQAGTVIGRTQQGPPHPFWALESGGHLPCCAYEGPIAMQNRQQLGGSCFIQNWQGPLSWLLHAHQGPGESRGARGPKGAPGSPQLQSGRKLVGGPPLPSPAVRPCLLPRQSGWGRALVHSAQLSFGSLNSKRRHCTGLPGWRGGGGHTMAKIEGSGGGQGCHPQSEGATGGHWHGGLRAAWSRGPGPGRGGRGGGGGRMAWAMRPGRACREAPSASRRLSRAARRASSSSCWACSSDMRSYRTFWVCQRWSGRERRGQVRERDAQTQREMGDQPQLGESPLRGTQVGDNCEDTPTLQVSCCSPRNGRTRGKRRDRS